MKELPARTIKLKIGEDTYEVSFPNNGQLIDIETLKQNLSKGTMDTLLMSRSAQSNLAYLTIQTIATFTVLIPDLKNNLRVDSLLDLNPYETKQLRLTYTDEFYPWFKEWMDIINDEGEKEESEDDKAIEVDRDEEIIDGK